MDDATIKEGDVVQLKSGGTAMTVGKVDEDNAQVRWFYEGEIHTATVPTNALKKTEGAS